MPEVVAVLGNVKFCTKAIKPVLQEAPKKEAPKPQQKKEEKKPEDDDDEEKPKKKEANPLDVLPPTTFNLYDFKTFFVNSKDKKGEGMATFLQQYDREGYTIYFFDYQKYEGEGVVLY